jgi:hypothetical protein
MTIAIIIIGVWLIGSLVTVTSIAWATRRNA